MSETQVKEEVPEPVQVTNKYDSTQLKIAVDDEIARFYSKELDWKQSHTHTDVKLISGYVSCLIAAGAFLNEYKTSFNEALPITILCVIAYWVIQLAAFAYSYFVEKNEIFVGALTKDGKTIASLVISGKANKFSPLYKLDYKFTDKLLNKTVHYKTEPNITTWFDTTGVLVKPMIQKDLSVYLENAKQSLHKK
ncbi:signal peptidase complex subunit 2 [Choanephora cucurbitarum]|nr:signal peptidase complex subunit 2 [Choanephora cucurbitarum]